MKHSLLGIGVLTIIGATTLAQTARTDFWGSPKEVVEHLWEMGVRGELLTTEGWSTASSFYAKPSPEPSDKSFGVYSNYYGLYRVSINGDKAEVVMDYDDGGRIDSNLRYSPPSKPKAFKTGIVFNLTLTPSYTQMFGPDGKTEIERKPMGPGYSAWKIEGPTFPRWTTVNTAIRYVLEMRNKTTDPATKKNADETLTKLLTLH